MRVPIRKPGKFTHLKPDPHLTQEKFDQLTRTFNDLKKSHPEAAREVRRLAELGDLSENAAYQIAKGRLRSINQRLLDLEDHLRRAVIITPTAGSATVRLGSTVTIEHAGKQITYTLLGSSETDPKQNIISHNSPLGAALLGRSVGDTVLVKLKSTSIEYSIVSII